MTQQPLELTDELLDVVVLLSLAAACPLAGTPQGGVYLEAPDAPDTASHSDESEVEDSVPVRDADYYGLDDEERYGEPEEHFDPQTGFAD